MLLYATYLLYAFNINLLALYLKTYFLNRPVISFPHIFYIEDTFYDISWIMKHAYYVNSDIKGHTEECLIPIFIKFLRKEPKVG